jgi:selenocysteine lyase/cysteine desulfurase
VSGDVTPTDLRDAIPALDRTTHVNAGARRSRPTRVVVADHFGADATEIALTQSTTGGINRIAAALDWERSDTMVRTDPEHSSGILPWKRLQRRGLHG